MVLLVVEDLELSRTVLAHQLERRGYEVRTAGTAAEAIAKVEERTPKFVILDRILPDDDKGDIFPQTVAKLNLKDKPYIIVASGLMDDEPLSWPGVKAILRKPYDVEDVMREIAGILQREGKGK